jgi:hypothetical protein
MKKLRIPLAFLILALAQLACGLPTGPGLIETPVGAATSVTPRVVTATTAPGQTATPTNTSVPTNTPTTTPTATATRPSGGDDGGSPQTCTYLATFVSDVTIPDDTVLNAGASFTKTWRVRNDGSCTWGPNRALHALAFTGGSRLGAVDQVSLPGNVGPGQTIDLSVGMVAPSSPGTYTSEWKFAISNPPPGVGSFLGLGSGRTQPLFTRIVVGPTPTATRAPQTHTRIDFAAGATQATVDGQVKANGVRSYVLSAGKDQLLMASFSSARDDLGLRIVNARNGNVLLLEDGPEGRVWLPETGDYYVQILGGSQDANFILGVIIPRRVSFDPGAISATLDGRVSNHAAVMYLLRAQAGQTMTVKLSNFPSAALALTIYGLEDGQPLLRSDFGLTEWTGELNVTQDYVIMVVPSVDTATYTIQFIVE